MLLVTPSPAPYIRIRATGLLRAADYRSFEPAFAAELARRAPPVPLLLDLTGFRGWTPAALLRDPRHCDRMNPAPALVSVAKGAFPMAYYRLYVFDRFSGHIDHFREFEAAHDAAAVAQGADWREADAMELWCGRRKVKRWEALALVPEARARSAVSALRAPLAG